MKTASPDELRIGGVTPLSTTDWPGMLALVVFLRGCPWACAYCHNAHLRRARGPSEPRWFRIVEFLRQRRGLLDAVVFSGGEPTSQAGLSAAMETVRAHGFKVGLHTAGSYPDRLAKVLPVVDWIGFDVKAPFADYARVTGVAGSGERAEESLRLIRGSGKAFEVRTTVHSAQLFPADLAGLANDLATRGVGCWTVQHFRQQGCADPVLAALPHDRVATESYLSLAGGPAVTFR